MRLWFLTGTLLMALFGWWGQARDRYTVDRRQDTGLNAPVRAMDDPVPFPTPK